MPIVSATQEGKAIEMLEPRRRRLQWAEITPLHSSLGNMSKTLSKIKTGWGANFLNRYLQKNTYK